MFEEAFRKYQVDEQELKNIIHDAVKGLIIFRPDDYSEELLICSDSNNSPESILYELSVHISYISELRELFAEIEMIERLRITAFRLDNLLNFEYLTHAAMNCIYSTFDYHFIQMRYALALGFIEKELGWKPLDNPNTIMDWLDPHSPEKPDKAKQFLAAKKANEEINRLLGDESSGKLFRELLDRYEKANEEYIKTTVAQLSIQNFFRILLEAIAVNARIIEKYLDSEEDPLEEMKDIFEGMLKIEKKIRSSRLGIKRGGVRKRNTFTWNDERKVDFYNKVENLPKIKNKSAWQFALDELIEGDFDFETIQWLKSRPALKEVPPPLFDEAVKKWRKYDEVSQIEDDEDKPRYFEFRHALHLLNYPDEFKFGTLRNNYFGGQKLSKGE